MADVLTGSPGIDDLIREILDDDEDEGGEWAGITELTEIFPTRLDGVNGPASGIPALMAKGARRPVATRVLKANAAKRMTMHVAYPVDAVDRARAMDGAQDFAKADALEAGAHEFMKAGAPIGTDHRDGTTGAGTCLESWIHRAPPWSMTAVDGSVQTVNPGDWCVLVQWSPAAWSRFMKGDLNGVSMQGSAKRRKPPASALAGVRKSAKPPKCGKCGKRQRVANPSFCGNCGARFGVAKSAAVLRAGAERAALAKSAALAAAHQAAQAEDWAGYLLNRARTGDPGARASAIGRLDAEFGDETALRLLSGELTPFAIGSRVAKSAAVAGASQCKTCKGGGRLRHPATGRRSRVCPSCEGSGQWAPGGDDADISKADADLIIEWGRQAKAAGGRAGEAIGYLSAMLGPDVASRLVTGIPVSPGDMRRGYLAAGRAGLSAAPGQEPRIPQSTHVAEASDFRRPPLSAGQSRPAPGSAWPGQGGQRDSYAPGPGIGRDPGSAAYPLPGLAASRR